MKAPIESNGGLPPILVDRVVMWYINRVEIVKWFKMDTIYLVVLCDQKNLNDNKKIVLFL